jgi:hypothetical protein
VAEIAIKKFAASTKKRCLLFWNKENREMLLYKVYLNKFFSFLFFQKPQRFLNETSFFLKSSKVGGAGSLKASFLCLTEAPRVP